MKEKDNDQVREQIQEVIDDHRKDLQACGLTLSDQQIACLVKVVIAALANLE